MAKIDIYQGQTFDSSNYDLPFPERLEVSNSIAQALLPKFATGVFKTVAANYYNNDGGGLKAQFGKMSLLADGIAGRFMVTLTRGESMITFGSCREEPFNHFRTPSLTSYYGSPQDWSLMIDQAAQGLKRAKREGREVLKPYGVIAAMFGG